jgi:hypothetical protein
MNANLAAVQALADQILARVDVRIRPGTLVVHYSDGRVVSQFEIRVT